MFRGRQSLLGIREPFLWICMKDWPKWKLRSTMKPLLSCPDCAGIQETVLGTARVTRLAYARSMTNMELLPQLAALPSTWKSSERVLTGKLLWGTISFRKNLQTLIGNRSAMRLKLSAIICPYGPYAFLNIAPNSTIPTCCTTWGSFRCGACLMVRVSDFWTLLLAWLQPSQSPTKSFDNGSVSGYNAASLRFGGEMLELDDMLFINAGTPGRKSQSSAVGLSSDTSANLWDWLHHLLILDQS